MVIFFYNSKVNGKVEVVVKFVKILFCKIVKGGDDFYLGFFVVCNILL